MSGVAATRQCRRVLVVGIENVSRSVNSFAQQILDRSRVASGASPRAVGRSIVTARRRAIRCSRNRFYGATVSTALGNPQLDEMSADFRR